MKQGSAISPEKSSMASSPHHMSSRLPSKDKDKHEAYKLLTNKISSMPSETANPESLKVPEKVVIKTSNSGLKGSSIAQNENSHSKDMIVQTVEDNEDIHIYESNVNLDEESFQKF